MELDKLLTEKIPRVTVIYKIADLLLSAVSGIFFIA